MIRHIELMKIGEVYEGKFREQQLVELDEIYRGMLDRACGIVSYDIHTQSDSLDPLVADIMVVIDFEDEEAMEAYDLDFDRLALQFRMAEQAESMLTYDIEL